MVCRMFGTTPLAELMLTCFQLDPSKISFRVIPIVNTFLTKMHLKMSPAKHRLFRSRLNALPFRKLNCVKKDHNGVNTYFHLFLCNEMLLVGNYTPKNVRDTFVNFVCCFYGFMPRMYPFAITMTSWWARWRLRSPASLLFVYSIVY